jgi:spore germination protein YaaH
MIMHTRFTILSLGVFLLFPLGVSALEVSGWIPYWRVSEGVKDAREHIEELDTIHPFGYSVKQDGSLNDLADIESREWSRLFRTAEKEGVEIIPTIMWSNGLQIHQILSDENLRERHIEEIIDMVEEGEYDGVDIDYEAKLAETNTYFSRFLRELARELDGKILSCTIEARTPPDSLYRVIPPTIQYANDYEEIGEHCDRIQIMAYDQGRADIKLNDARIGTPYTPVADTAWVEKVIRLAVETFPREKIVLAVPTYGYEYELSVAPEWFQGYKRLWSLNPGYGVATAEEYDIIPSHNSGGELSFSYFASSSPFHILNILPTPEGTTTGNAAAAKALLFASATGMTVPVNYVVWSDAGAIKEKIELAEEFNLRGISIFKIDGGEDQSIWEELE